MQASAEDYQWLNPEYLNRNNTLVRSEPFPFLIAKDMLDPGQKSYLNKDFPPQGGAGYLPYDATACGQSFNALIDALVSRPMANAIGEKLGIENLSQYPVYISISQSLNKRHGTIHTDGKSKVATALLYLNDDWVTASKGCLRFLNKSNDIEDMIVPEIPPIYGTLVAFKRCDNSFHGHLPYEGNRRVIQVAWLVSEADKNRKAQRGKLSSGLKHLLGWVDQKIGQHRKDNASRK